MHLIALRRAWACLRSRRHQVLGYRVGTHQPHVIGLGRRLLFCVCARAQLCC